MSHSICTTPSTLLWLSTCGFLPPKHGFIPVEVVAAVVVAVVVVVVEVGVPLSTVVVAVAVVVVEVVVFLSTCPTWAFVVDDGCSVAAVRFVLDVVVVSAVVVVGVALLLVVITMAAVVLVAVEEVVVGVGLVGLVGGKEGGVVRYGVKTVWCGTSRLFIANY